MLRMRAPVIYFLSWTTTIILGCYTKMTSTPNPSPSQQTNYQQNWESWWSFAKKTSTMPKNFRSEPTTRPQSREVISRTIKFGWIANISRPNKTGSWNQSSLDHSESYILLESKPINYSFLKNGKFMMFFTGHCWSKTLLGRGKWTKKLDKWSPTLATMRSTKWRQFGTMQSMQRSQN